MLKQKLTDKFSNIFSRDKKQKQEQSRKEQQVFFNESYFQCKLVYNPHRLALIKVIANITVGPDAGTPMMANCKWFAKKNNHYSQIQGVTSSCYQPCIQDVGCSILVQITPIIEGKTYSGATITKQTGALELGSQLQSKFTETKSKLYYQKQSISFVLKVQAIFGKQTQYSNLDYPQDGQLNIKKQEDSNFEIQVRTSQFKAYFWITKQFPTLQFIRKSYNSVVVSFTQFQSMRLAFKDGADREIFGLLTRTLTANSTLDWKNKQNIQQAEVEHEQMHKIQQNLLKQQKIVQQKQHTQFPKTPPKNQQIKQNSQNDLQQEKQQSSKNGDLLKSTQKAQKSQKQLQHHDQKEESLTPINTPVKIQEMSPLSLPQLSPVTTNTVQMQLKIGELNIELNKLKKEHKDLVKNYNIEKQNKCKLEHQVKKLNDKLIQFDKINKQKMQAEENIEKLKQDNRFLKNQVTLLNKNFKKKQSQLNNFIIQKQNLEVRIKKFEKAENQLKKPSEQNSFVNDSANWKKLNNQLSQQNEELKSQIQKLQNKLRTVNKKLQSILNEKSINTHQVWKSQPLIPAAVSSDDSLSKDKIIDNLQFKISNLQMLLKHRSGQKGNQTLALHKIINNMTEDITQKQQQLEHVKKLNKQLAEKIQVLTKSLSEK